MSTPEQPLTRRQLKEMRRTGALPVVDPAAAPAEEPAHVGAASPGSEAGGLAGLPKAAPVTPQPAAPAPADPPAPEEPSGKNVAPPHPAPAAEPAKPTAASQPLTRRQARQLRTNEIPVGGPSESPADDQSPEVEAPGAAPAPTAEAESAKPASAAKPEPAQPERAPKPSPAEPEPITPGPQAAPGAAETPIRLPAGFTDALSASPASDAAAVEKGPAAEGEQEERPKVGASFGAAVFEQAEERQRLERERAAREAQQRREAAATATVEAQPATKPADENELFAEAFQRSLDAGGSNTATGTSLVLHDMPGTASLSAPMTATGEFMITSSHVLPAGLASRGSAAGTTDGKDIDATLMDGEIPLHSSPTPIAASSAVSTSKAPGDVIRPPQPEKNHGLMLTLGIVAGVLGVGLAGILIYAFATGVIG